MLPVSQIAINNIIYPDISAVYTNAQQAHGLQVGDSVFATWNLKGQATISEFLTLDGATVSASFLFANNNWVNNILATFSITVGKPVRMTLSGASLGQIILGEWNPNVAEEFVAETMTAQLLLQTAVPLLAPKIVASFY